MEVLVLDGKNYVKASKAARELGYATDYVGQLCRSGQIDAHLIGRTWYVNQDELGNHKVEKKRISRVKAREYAKRTIEEFKKEKEKKLNNAKNIDIQYETDTEELIPTVRKLSIQKEIKPAKKVDYREDKPLESFTIENEGDRVQMSGDITVVDVTDGEIDDETVLMHPKISRKHRTVSTDTHQPMEETAKIEISGKDEQSAEVEAESVNYETKPNFLSRLEESGVLPEDIVAEESKPLVLSSEAHVPLSKSENSKESLFPYLVILIAILLTTTMSTFAYQYITISTESGVVELTTQYKFNLSISAINSIIATKI